MEVQSDALVQINSSLAKISTDIEYIKSDIQELKGKDLEADKKLEAAYAKALDYARTRQDRIKDDLQHQIDDNKTSISMVHDRVNMLENKKARSLVSWYDRIVDKVIWVALGTIGIAILRYVSSIKNY